MSHVLELSKKMASIAYHALDSKKGEDCLLYTYDAADD